MNKDVKLEENYHNSVASMYFLRRKHEFIWEVPEELLVFRKTYFKENLNVIDMGCGPAVSVVNLLNKQISNYKYTGVDISKKLLKIAKSLLKAGTFIYADMSTVKLKVNSYDILLSLGALHHCNAKNKTIDRWISFVKPGGYLILREPIYEFLRRGTGESPTEEGIKVDNLIRHLSKKPVKIVKITFFSSNAFHLFNRIMIHFGLGRWRDYRFLWYPVVWMDILMSKLSKYGHIFTPQAFVMVLKKL